jgi:hypothetical protein
MYALCALGFSRDNFVRNGIKIKYHFHGVSFRSYLRPQKAHDFTVGAQPHASCRLGFPQYCGTVLLSTKIASLKTTLYLNLVP